MRIKLLNYAMMPKSGQYKMKRLTKEQFIDHLNKTKFEEIDSYIGYQQNIDLLEKWGCQHRFSVSREKTSLADGDVMLVMRLDYRPQNPASKGSEVNEDDFEFFEITFTL